MKPHTLALLGLLPGLVSANQPIEILISAGRTAEPGLAIPAGYRIIDRAEIANSGARQLPELLQRNAGIQITDGVGGGGSATIDMRGFGATAASNVAILIDGRKINSPSDSSTLYLNSVDLDNVERIEVIEGSAGTLYGNQAVGGMINIITRRPGVPHTSARAGLGSYDTRELGASHSGRIGNGIGISINASAHTSDNYRQHNASEVKRLSAALEVPHNGGHIRLSVSHLDDYQKTPGALLAAEVAADRRQVTADFVNDYFDTRSDGLRISTQQSLNAHWRFEGDLSLRRDRRDFIQSFRGFGPGSLTTQDRDSIEFNPRLVARLDSVTLTLGADLQHTDYLLLSSLGPQGNQQAIQAAYVQAQLQIDPQLSLTAGLRHARVENQVENIGASAKLDDELNVGSLGLVYRPSHAWRLYARADQNYRFAKVDEHTNPVFGQPLGLKNQTGVSYETGVDWSGRGANLKARLYRLDLENEISNDASAFLANINLDRSRRIGAGLSGDVDVGRSVRIGASYDYVDSEITSGTHTGSQVPLVAEHRATLFGEWQIDAHWSLRADLEYTGERFLGSDFANSTPPLEAHTVVDLSAHYKRGPWRFDARIDNLFNELYNESGAAGFGVIGYNPAPERSLMLTAGYTFE